jgi:hypothetical protein
MKELFFTLIVICSFLSLTFAQRQKGNNSRILVDANKPAVFITFLSLKEIKPDDPTDDKNNLFFKITNNTRGKIWLQMSGVSKKDYGEASLYYEINDESKDTSFGSLDCHVCSVNPVGSKRSIIFSIPLSQASYDALMQIKYSFDWERDSENIGSSYSTHLVGFALSSLPKSVIQLIQSNPGKK